MIKKNKFMLLGLIGSLVLAVGFMVVAPAFAQVTSYAQLSGNTTLKVGSKGADVSALQTFMSSGKDIYPAGLITGYFGTLTKNAVVQLQLAYDLTADGIAGFNTRSKINSVIGIGQGMDISAPITYNLTNTTSGRSAYINFSTNEPVKVTVFYDVNPISWSEATTSFGVPTISGSTNIDTTFSSSKQITLSNLSANSTYHYTVMTTDMNGNISVTWPSTFTIGQ